MTQIPVAGLHAELALGTAKMQSGVGDAERLLTRLQEKMTGTGRKAKKAGDEIDTGVGKGLKGAAASASAFERRMDFLQKRFDPLYAASKRYEGELRLLDEAHKRGAISSATYTRNLDRLNAELAGVSTAANTASGTVDRFSGSARGMAAQTGNIAAQFQDIGVQLAGGQSPLLIALQQGTQLNGVFTSMGGNIRSVGPLLLSAFQSLISPISLVTIGVIAGGGALFQWAAGAQKAKSDSEALKAETERLKSIMDGLTESTRALRLERETAASGASGEAEQNALNEINRLTQEREQILLRIDQLQAGRAAGFRQAAQDERDALDARIAEIDVAVQQLKAEQDLGLAARQRANEIRDSYQDQWAAAETLRAKMIAAYQVYAMTRNMAVSLADETFRAAQAASSLAYQRELSRTGQSSGPDSVRSRVQFGGGAFAPPVRGAGLRFSGIAGRSGGGGGGGGRAGGAEAAGLSDIAREVQRLNKAIKDGTTPIEKYRAGLAKLEDLKKSGLTELAYSKEAARLNEELTNSLPLVDDVADAFGAFVSRGFSDFKSFTDSIMGSFKKMLAEMIATAAKNQILIAIGGKAAGGGGLLAGLLGGGGGAGGGLLGGLGKILGIGGGGAGGGLLGGLGKILGIGGAAGGAAGGGLLAGLGGAAALGPIGIGVALLGGLFGRRRAKKKAEKQRRELERAAAEESQKQQRTGLENQIFALEGNTAELRRRELAALAPANRALQERIWKLEDEQRVSEERKGLEGALLTIEGNTAELRRQELEALAPANRALQERIWKLEDEQRASEELKGLEGELLALQGNTAELRRRELETLIPANREMQERIWQLEDEQRVSEERKGLEGALLTIEGNTAELRRRELETLVPANRALQERIWQLEDEQRISGERKGLEEELLQLQGDTAELRRRELEALDPSNRALKENIWRLEDAAEATETLNEALGRFKDEDFASLLDFNRARGALASGSVAPSVVPFTGGIDPARQAVRNDDLWTSINTRLAQIEKYIVAWDIDGLPAERAA